MLGGEAGGAPRGCPAGRPARLPCAAGSIALPGSLKSSSDQHRVWLDKSMALTGRGGRTRIGAHAGGLQRGGSAQPHGVRDRIAGELTPGV